MRIDPVVEKVLAELKFNPKDCLWEKHSAVCMKHRYIEIAGQHKGVIINELSEVEKDSSNGVVSIKCTASLGKAKVITYGEASPKNNKNAYPYAMAEKRAIDRAILKLIGIHGFVYSDDEVSEEINVEPVKVETKKKEIKQPVFANPNDFVNIFKKILETESKNSKTQKNFEDKMQPYLKKYGGDLEYLPTYSSVLHEKLQQTYIDTKENINKRNTNG